MFLKAVASLEYADIDTTLQLNVDSYRHIDDEYFLPQHDRITNIAMLVFTTMPKHGCETWVIVVSIGLLVGTV